jgi:hypothetical protein
LANNTSSTSGADSMTQAQPDGSYLNYVSTNCNLIASIDDNNGGNVLGSTKAIVHVEGTIPTHNNQPYVPRWYDITPTNQGAADVTLYFTQADFDAYNTYATANGWPLLPTSGSNTDPNIANIRITKVSGGTLGAGTNTVITPTSTWDATNNYWTLAFNVPSFSGFYVHSVNVNNSPLSIDVVLQGKATGNANALTWTASSTQQIKQTELLYSTDGNNYASIATWSGEANNYQHQNYVQGNNYYKLKLQQANNTFVYSNVVNVHRSASKPGISIYPNPATNNINIALQSFAKNSFVDIKIFDATGKVVSQSQHTVTQTNDVLTLPISNLAVGMYHVQVQQGNGVVYVQKWSKME